MQFANNNELLYLEVSARENMNVERIFETLTDSILAKLDDDEINTDLLLKSVLLYLMASQGYLFILTIMRMMMMQRQNAIDAVAKNNAEC